jgi:23S rRNA G2445 N2-methylase RlmL
MAASIPWEILSSRKEHLRVLDPMAGSGTSLIVARGAGHVASGFDLDPLAVHIAKVGTSDAQVAQVQEAAQNALSAAKRMTIAGRQAYPDAADEETREYVRYWFDLEARKQLAALRGR